MKLLSILLLFLLSCQAQQSNKKTQIKPKPKNIILLIGDGMGFQQLNLGNLYLGSSANKKYSKKQLSLFSKTHKTAISLVKPQNALVVDSACSATQLATGEPAISETIGVTAKGEKTQTILELAKGLGKSTGVISNTRLTHATPASFVAHTTSRHDENKIAQLMINADVDYMISGGLRYFIPKNHKSNKGFQSKWQPLIEPAFTYSSKRKDNLNLLDMASNKGYEVSTQFKNFKNSTSKKQLALLGNSALPFAIDLKPQEASVPQFTQATLKKLSTNPKGFFLMVEEGLIDWAGHANDAASMLHEVIQMDKTYEVILKWAQGRDDTIVIVTADHETGGFGFSYKGKEVQAKVDFPGDNFPDTKFAPRKNYGNAESFNRILKQKVSFGSFMNKFMRNNSQASDLCEQVEKSIGVTLPMQNCEDILKQSRFVKKASKQDTLPNLHHEYLHNYTNTPLELHNLLGKALAPHFNTVWATGSHTSTPVGIFVWGPQSMNYKGLKPVMTHPELGQLMKKWLKNSH